MYVGQTAKKFIHLTWNSYVWMNMVCDDFVEDSPVEKVEQQMTALGDKLSDLESDNDDLRKERNDAVAKLRVWKLMEN